MSMKADLNLDVSVLSSGEGSSNYHSFEEILRWKWNVRFFGITQTTWFVLRQKSSKSKDYSP